jgi:hypothetical protein
LKQTHYQAARDASARTGDEFFESLSIGFDIVNDKDSVRSFPNAGGALSDEIAVGL